MAITKILNINAEDGRNPASHLQAALDYIQNPDKTEACHLVGSINCSPDTAFEQMMETKQTYEKTDKRQGYHIIISFNPDESVTTEQAKYVAENFIRDVLKGEYEVVYAIHTDKEHMHIHIIWNSVSFQTGMKYESPKGNWKYHLQPTTNKYCAELGLQIMPAEYAKDPVNMSKEKWEYEQSFKEYILYDAKMCMAYAGSTEHFIFLMKRLGYEMEDDQHLSVRVPGQKLFHRLDKMDELFQKDTMKYAFGNGAYSYHRHYYTGSVRYIKCAKLTPLQRKHYAKMYRLSVIEKRGFCYRSAELAAEIKKMQQLQEQYLFLCKKDIASVVDLIDINMQNKMRMDEIDDRQHEIYAERASRKRKCKSTENLREYQLWHMESQQELDRLKVEKKELKQQIRMGESCLKENIRTAEYLIDESEELDYGAKDEIPNFGVHLEPDVEQAAIEEADLDIEEQNSIAVGIAEDVTAMPKVEEKRKLTIHERVEQICETIVESGKGYEELSFRDKLELFHFDLEDITENLALHSEVLAELGIKYSGADMFEDYQGIYDETVKNAELEDRMEDTVSAKSKQMGRNR
ncbi:MAG: relaxase/mobilization nuclease domain-containing protein [Anaerostipes sp.]|jgi:hypothetical protein